MDFIHSNQPHENGAGKMSSQFELGGSEGKLDSSTEGLGSKNDRVDRLFALQFEQQEQLRELQRRVGCLYTYMIVSIGFGVLVFLSILDSGGF